MTEPKKKSDARNRIVTTAERLFYADGIRAVGIDRIIAEAGVAKMTLYNHFKSKDDLILAALIYRERQFDAFIEHAMNEHQGRGKTQFEAFFATLADWFSSAGFRGCSFINAAVELANSKHPASEFSRQHKERFRQKVTQILVECFGQEAAKLSSSINLLIEGAIVKAVMDNNPHSALVAFEAAKQLVLGSKN